LGFVDLENFSGNPGLFPEGLILQVEPGYDVVRVERELLVVELLRVGLADSVKQRLEILILRDEPDRGFNRLDLSVRTELQPAEPDLYILFLAEKLLAFAASF
jgi:hypothetical protein